MIIEKKKKLASIKMDILRIKKILQKVKHKRINKERIKEILKIKGTVLDHIN